MHPHNAQHLLGALKLGQFTERDIEESFARLDTDRDGRITASDLAAAFDAFGRRHGLSEKEVAAMGGALVGLWDDGKTGCLDKSEFRKHCVAAGERVHPVIYQLAGCIFLMCLPYGILVPYEPQLVSALGITAAQFGIAQGMLFCTKFLVNIPITDVVDRVGSKALLVGSTVVLGLSIGGLSLVTSFPGLVLCRAIGGFGLAGLYAAIQAAAIRIQTPLNRARSNAPFTQAVNAGTAMGPAIGGLLSGYMTMESAFAGVGATFVLCAAANARIYDEVAPAEGSAMANPWQLFSTAFGSWYEVVRTCPEVRGLLAMQGSVYAAIAGTQLTLMPLLLFAEPLCFSAPQIGGLSAAVAALGVVVTQPLAHFADRYGRANALVLGGGTMAASMAAVPLVGTPALVSGAVATAAVGQNLCTPSIGALVIDSVVRRDPRLVTQALSLLRSVTDVGMVSGAALIGAIGTDYGFVAGYEVSSATVLLMSVYTFMRLPEPPKIAKAK